jgi:xylan 1,4-beta-xylosidase
MNTLQATILVVVAPLTLAVWAHAVPAIDVAIDLSSRTKFPHYFERCVGSGHGALTLREDWRQHVDMAHNDLGIQRVRFHGILDDDMSVSFSPNETGFVNIDSICDWLVQRNMSMVMELGFMPRWLARDRSGAVPVISKGQQDTVADGNYSCTHSINHYIGCSDPPYDFDLWGALIYKLGNHLVERYGIEELGSKWMFEVVRKQSVRLLL